MLRPLHFADRGHASVHQLVAAALLMADVGVCELLGHIFTMRSSAGARAHCANLMNGKRGAVFANASLAKNDVWAARQPRHEQAEQQNRCSHDECGYRARNVEHPLEWRYPIGQRRI
jgi:hypothetical protein